MRRAVAGFWWSPTVEGTPALIVTAIFFAFGGLTGCFFALWSAGGGVEAMSGYLGQFLANAQSAPLQAPALLEQGWRSLRWPLAVFLLGFTALGSFGIPAASALRGFYLSFSVAAFAQAYGGKGLTMAFFLLGVPALVSIPAFFVLATQSFSAACSLAGRAGGQGRRELPYHRDYFFRCAVCAGMAGAGLLLERYLVPVLIAGWARALPL